MTPKSLLKNNLKKIQQWKIISGRSNLFVYERLWQLLKLKLVVFAKILQPSFECSIITLIFFYNNSMV